MYTGETYRILCGVKGLNNNLNISAIEPDYLISPSKNIDLTKGGWGKRGGTAKVNSTTITDSPRIMGIYDFLKIGGSQFVVLATSDGKIYKTSSLTIKTGLGTSKYANFSMFNNEMFFCNGYNVPQTWDGAASSTVPLSGVAAQGTITMSGIAVANETFVVGTQTFTWKASRSIAGEVTIGTTAAEAVTNIVTAITADLATVTASDGAGDTVVVTAASVGTAGNSIVFTEASTNMAVDGSGTLGSTTAGVADTTPTDWTGTNYPAVMIKHGRGNSERMWAFGCLSTPYSIYVTPDGNGKDFSDANVVIFNIDTGDNAGIIGGVVYKDQLILFGKRNTFIMDDADTNTDNWGYSAFTREGGVAHQRLVIPTQNDIICMMEDGTIYSLSAAEQYGDYKAASITRPMFMDRWIQDNVRLSYIEHFHGKYDPVKKKVKIFVVRNGQTEVDTAMVYYTETGQWMIEDNVDYNSGYSASASALVKTSVGVYEIYTGDYSGFIWKLEQSATNDGNNGYKSKALTPYLYFENARISKHYHKCLLDIKPEATDSLDIRYYINDIYNNSIKMAGDTEELGTETLARNSFKIGRIGEKIQLEFTNETADEDFFISQILIDYKPIGSR